MEWYVWIALGAFLLAFDIALLNVYYLLWFGLGALMVGGLVFFIPEVSYAIQLFTFSIFSVLLLAVWLLVLLPRKEKLAIAKCKEEIVGVTALVTRFNNGEGIIRLQSPIGSKDTWKFTSKDQLKVGDSVKIISLGDNGVVFAALPVSNPAIKSGDSNDDSNNKNKID